MFTMIFHLFDMIIMPSIIKNAQITRAIVRLGPVILDVKMNLAAAAPIITSIIPALIIPSPF